MADTNVISRDEGLFLLDYAEVSLNDIEEQLKYMKRYVDTAITLDPTVPSELIDITLLGEEFNKCLLNIDGITVAARYDDHHIFAPNMDYDLLNLSVVKGTTKFVNPLTTDYTSLFKRTVNVNGFADIGQTVFKTIDNSGINYVNCKFVTPTTSADNDTINDILDLTKKYYYGTADTYITLFFPCITVDGLFSSFRREHAYAGGVRDILAYETDNPFIVSDVDRNGESITDPKSKMQIWKMLLDGNTKINKIYLRSNNTPEENYVWGHDSTYVNTKCFERIKQYRKFIKLQKDRILAVSNISSNIVLVDNLNKLNNSIPEEIRITHVKNSLINIVDYIPQFIRDAYPDAAAFMEFFQTYLNTMYHGEGNYVLTGADADPQYSTYDADGNLIGSINMSIPNTQRISILEKIKRLSEIHDPELIDFEFLSHFANMLGYKQSGFALNFNDAFNALALGYSIDGSGPMDISVDSRKYIRHFISNLPSFYRIKSTNNCIKVLLYSFGLIGDLQTVYSTDYRTKWKSPKVFWNDTTQLVEEDLAEFLKLSDGLPWVNTPHFKINIDLAKSAVPIGFDSKIADSIYRAIEAVRPINSVFDGLNGIFYDTQPLEVYAEPPVTNIMANSTSADTIKHNYTIMIADSFRSIPSDSNSYKVYDINSAWKNGYTSVTSAALPDLPNSGNCILFESLYTVPSESDIRTYQLGKYHWINPARNETEYYTALTAPYSDTSATMVLVPGLDDLNDTSISARFTQMCTSANINQSSATSAGIGFNLKFIESGGIYHNENVFFSLTTSADGRYQLNRSAITSLYPSAYVTSGIQLPVLTKGGDIFLKVIRNRIGTSSLTFDFYYKSRYKSGSSWIETKYNLLSAASLSFTIFEGLPGWPKIQNSPYAIVKMNHLLSNDAVNPNLGLTGLTLVGSTI